MTLFTTAAVLGQPRALRGFLLKPETGRTHQLRVAMKSLGAPVLGDEVRASCLRVVAVSSRRRHVASVGDYQ